MKKIQEDHSESKKLHETFDRDIIHTQSSQHENDIHQFNKSLTAKENKLKEANKEIETLNKLLNQNAAKYNEELKSLIEQLTLAKDKNQDLEKTMQEKDNLIHSVTQQLELTNNAVEELRKQAEQLRQQLNSANTYSDGNNDSDKLLSELCDILNCQNDKLVVVVQSLVNHGKDATTALNSTISYASEQRFWKFTLAMLIFISLQFHIWT
ncbi:hypothetical protein TRFO_39027 [Tritrichomonas foetus]|uniref:Uncharacterized protein n=1 Tax=Tritrichomonas foetus TaxID=1144522 RepID=A0A1J4J985_9EUKA|nr:hypothetical protein TRFO_39027 [Tritrichomonas foetus]|eukprot:OHS94807.1 hypothetical protein TRFO_39027 [Tritrichomonas foetus]